MMETGQAVEPTQEVEADEPQGRSLPEEDSRRYRPIWQALLASKTKRLNVTVPPGAEERLIKAVHKEKDLDHANRKAWRLEGKVEKPGTVAFKLRKKVNLMEL